MSDILQWVATVASEWYRFEISNTYLEYFRQIKLNNQNIRPELRFCTRIFRSSDEYTYRRMWYFKCAIKTSLRGSKSSHRTIFSSKNRGEALESEVFFDTIPISKIFSEKSGVSHESCRSWWFAPLYWKINASYAASSNHRTSPENDLRLPCIFQLKGPRIFRDILFGKHLVMER